MRAAAACFAIALGCGTTAAGPGAETDRPAGSPAPLDALPGHWMDAAGSSSETWLRIGAPLVGVGFAAHDGVTGWFEVMIVHQREGRAVLTAMPAGATQVDFTADATAAPDELWFANPSHDDPKQLRYRRSGDALQVAIDGDGGARAVTLQRAGSSPAAELEELDIAFATDSAARGGAAWAERFEADGVTWPIGAARTVGPDHIAANIDRMRERGALLRWAPVASGLSPAGDMGFTAGSYWIDLADGGEPGGGTGVYVSIWRRGADRVWRLAFDTGVPTAR